MDFIKIKKPKMIMTMTMTTNKIRKTLNEKLLNDLKSLILFVQKHRSNLHQEQHKQKFLFDQTSVSNRINSLSDDDRNWIEKEYQKWYEKEILPLVKKEINKINKNEKLSNDDIK
jgi:hypothetical protein